MSKTFVVTGRHNPAIYVAPDGRTFIVPHWVEVPTGTTLQQVQWTPDKVAVKTAETIKQIRREFASSRDARIKYVARLRTDGLKDCECSGFKYRRTCKHIDALKKEWGWK